MAAAKQSGKGRAAKPAPSAKGAKPQAATAPKRVKRAPPKPIKPIKSPRPPKKPTQPLTPMQAWRALPEDEALSELCGHVIEGGHLAGFCKAKGIAYVTMLDWINSADRRTEMYARAREDRSDVLADQIIAISDDSKSDTYIDGEGKERVDTEVVGRAKLRVDARKWVASKLKPRVYGEKLTLDGKVDHAKTTDEELIATLAKYGIATKIGPTQPEDGVND